MPVPLRRPPVRDASNKLRQVKTARDDQINYVNLVIKSSRYMCIPVVPLKQGETDCTLTCIMMLLAYYGFTLSRDEVARSLQANKQGHIQMVEVSRFFCSLGFDVDCLSYNLFYFGPHYAKLNPSETIKALRDERERTDDIWFQERIETTIKAIEEGVHYLFQRPSKQLITSYLHKGIPLLVAVNPCALRNEQGNIYVGHDIVLTGCEEDIVYYIDPLEGIEKTMSFDDLMFSILARKVIETSGFMVAMKKNKPRS